MFTIIPFKISHLYTERLSYRFYMATLPCLFLISLTGCLSNERLSETRSSNLPNGWALYPAHSTLLARSYPKNHWLTFLLKLSNKKSKLFWAPMPSTHTMNWLTRIQQKPFAPLAQLTKTKKRQSRGLSFSIKTTHPIALDIALTTKNTTEHKQIYTKSLFLPASKGRWLTKNIPFSDFQPTPQSTRKLVESSIQPQILFLGRQHPKNNHRQVTLTIRPPSHYTPEKKAIPSFGQRNIKKGYTSKPSLKKPKILLPSFPRQNTFFPSTQPRKLQKKNTSRPSFNKKNLLPSSAHRKNVFSPSSNPYKFKKQSTSKPSFIKRKTITTQPTNKKVHNPKKPTSKRAQSKRSHSLKHPRKRE